MDKKGRGKDGGGKLGWIGKRWGKAGRSVRIRGGDFGGGGWGGGVWVGGGGVFRNVQRGVRDGGFKL